MQNFSLHTHTKGFDGQNTEEEMISQAQKLGWETIGFSNHFIVHPKIKKSPMYAYAEKGGYNNIYSESFDEVIEKFALHYKKIDELKKSVNIRILKGMEVDFFSDDSWIDGFDKAIKYLKPDYLIGAAHFVEYNDVLFNSHDIKRTPEIEQNRLIHRYWQNERAAVQSGLFTFMAHLDLIKKVGLGIEKNWYEEELKTIAEIKKSGMIVELNTSYYKFGDEPYPSKRIVQKLAKESVPVIISDDAHAVKQLGGNFDRVQSFAEQLGVKNFLTLSDIVKNENYFHFVPRGREL